MIGEPVLIRVCPRGRLVATCALGVVIDGFVAWHFGWSRPLPAFLFLGAIGGVVVVTDLAARRIPRTVVLPAYPVAAALLALGCAPDGPWWPVVRAGLAAGAVAAGYLLLALAAPGQFGLGDVRLGGLLGGSLGFLGWSDLDP